MGRWAVRWRSCSAAAVCSAPSRSACCARCSAPSIRPDLVLGTSIGAVNGALVAADPTEAVTDRLVRLWASPEASEVYGDSVARQLRRFAARTHLHSPVPLRRLLERELGDEADVRRAERSRSGAARPASSAPPSTGSTAGPLVEAVLASRQRAGPAAAGADRRRALRRRRHRQLDPDRRGGRGRRQVHLRAAGGPDRAAADPAAPAVGGGAGGVRDRPAAPVRPGDGGATRRCRRACASDRRGRAPRRHPVGLPRHGRGRPADQPRLHRLPPLPRRALHREPAAAADAVTPVLDPAPGPRPGCRSCSPSSCSRPCRCGCCSRRPRRRSCPAACGRCG